LSLSLGLFDVFTYMAPGSLYLSVLLFVTSRSHLVNLGSLKDMPSIVLLAGVQIASYLLGWAAEPMANVLIRTMHARAASNQAAARQGFASMVPSTAGRPFVHADIYLLRPRRCTPRTRQRR